VSDPLLSLDHVAVGYRERVVLPEVTLSLRQGSFTGLLGANGSGKSTLLKTILGLLPPLAGQLTLHPVDGRAPRLGYVPQRDSLDPLFLFTSFEVVLQACCVRVGPGRFYGRAEKDWARECLRQVGAADLERQRFSRLSGGQKQRVLIARALAVRPDLLLLDEPTAGIDPAATQAVQELLRQCHAQQGLGILLVTHELAGLSELVKEVIWLRQGKILHGPAHQLLTRQYLEEGFEAL
jgi:ABC-type Mn2+/Zn2+ transport system ATPase subunit